MVFMRKLVVLLLLGSVFAQTVFALPSIRIDEKLNKLITNKAIIEVDGKVTDPAIVSVSIAAGICPLDRERCFGGTIDLKKGLNNIELVGYDKEGNEVTSESFQVLRTTALPEMPSNYPFREPLELLYTLGIIKPDKYGYMRPEFGITREELIKILNVPAAKSLTPKKTANRAEAVVLIARYDKIQLPIEIGKPPFPDIPVDYWAIKEIAAAKESGLLKDFIGLPFQPNQYITRGEVAGILVKTRRIQELVSSVLDVSQD
jgi:hypothetical protein